MILSIRVEKGLTKTTKVFQTHLNLFSWCFCYLYQEDRVVRGLYVQLPSMIDAWDTRTKTEGSGETTGKAPPNMKVWGQNPLKRSPNITHGDEIH